MAPPSAVRSVAAPLGAGRVSVIDLGEDNKGTCVESDRASAFYNAPFMVPVSTPGRGNETVKVVPCPGLLSTSI